jgi:cell division protein FtsL
LVKHIRDKLVHPNSEIVQKTEEKAVRQKRQVGFYYSFLTIVLLLCLVQIGFGMILNISKTISYQAKITTLEKIRDNAQVQNKNLKQEVSAFSSNSSLEGIARNNLKMAGQDEVLIIINEAEKKEER